MMVNIDWLIAKIDYELSHSTLSKYITTEGTQISTDVGYVEDWWDKYKVELRKCAENKQKGFTSF